MGLCDKECCEKCSRFKECGWCESCNGHPLKGYCFFYKLIKEKGYDGYLILKKELIEKINNLKIEHLHIDDLNLLLGNYINLEYTLENGSKIKLLNDNDIYLGNQVELPNDEKCYGIATNSKIIVISKYGCNGSNPELILYRKI